jgi:hypothetical protein
MSSLFRYEVTVQSKFNGNIDRMIDHIHFNSGRIVSFIPKIDRERSFALNVEFPTYSRAASFIQVFVHEEPMNISIKLAD